MKERLSRYCCCCCRRWYLLLGLLVLRPSISSLLQSATAFLLQSETSVIRKCDRASLHLSQLARTAFTSSHGCHFPGSTHKQNLKYFDQKYTANFTDHQNSSWRHWTDPSPHERQTNTPGNYVWEFFTKVKYFFFSFIFIAKMGDGLVCRIPNSGVPCKCNKPIWQRSFNKPSEATC